MPTYRKPAERNRFSTEGNLRRMAMVAFAVCLLLSILSAAPSQAQTHLIGRHRLAIDSSSEGSLLAPLWLHHRRGAFPLERPIPANTHVYRHVRYARSAGVAAHLLSVDIYSPANAEGCPVMIYVHGGALL